MVDNFHIDKKAENTGLGESWDLGDVKWLGFILIEPQAIGMVVL